MEDWIKNFGKQFEAPLEVVGNVPKFSRFIVVGMGGSNLATGLLKLQNKEIDIWAHRDYGLPEIEDSVLKNSLIILNSYSGNTEEVLDTFDVVVERGLNAIAISIGGTLLDKAKKQGIPYIQLPDLGLQPRMALGLSVRALALATGTTIPQEVLFNPADLEASGKKLAVRLQNKIPIIYASRRNFSLAYAWKTIINETAKSPAFCNAFPEVNHNEMSGFEAPNAEWKLSDRLHFVFLQDTADDPRIGKRMNLTKDVFQDRGLAVETVGLDGETPVDRIFSSLILCMWTSYHLAKTYGVSPEDLALVEEFKKKMAQ